MQIDEIETFIETFQGQPIMLSYHTTALGNGADDEREDGTLTGYFTGDSDNAGRTMRYRFVAKDGTRHYLFADEITALEAA